MKKLTYPLLLIIIITSFSSCYVNRHTIGNGPVGRTEADKKGVVIAKKRQYYLAWGGYAIERPSPVYPADCGYQIKTSSTILGTVCSILTSGFINGRMEKVIVFKDSPCAPKTKK